MKIRDLLRRDDDADVLEGEDAGREATSQPVRPAVVVHRIRIANAEAANALVGILRNYGYEPTTAGETVEIRDESADDDQAARSRATIEELAAEHGGIYEGTTPPAT